MLYRHANSLNNPTNHLMRIGQGSSSSLLITSIALLSCCLPLIPALYFLPSPLHHETWVQSLSSCSPQVDLALPLSLTPHALLSPGRGDNVSVKGRPQGRAPTLLSPASVTEAMKWLSATRRSGCPTPNDQSARPEPWAARLPYHRVSESLLSFSG